MLQHCLGLETIVLRIAIVLALYSAVDAIIPTVSCIYWRYIHGQYRLQRISEVSNLFGAHSRGSHNLENDIARSSLSLSY